MLHIGIECEQLESQSWGVGKIIARTLEEISLRPELLKQFRFHLYFKSEIPNYAWLDNPIFIKHVVWQPLPRHSFVLYYYLFLPIKLWSAKLDAMFWPNYMLPIIAPGRSLVMLTDDIYYEMRSPDQLFRHRLAYRVFGTWAVWRATKILAISEASKQQLKKLFNIAPERIAVNHLGVDKPASQSTSTTRQPRPYLLYVAQAFPRRHLRETLMAYQSIAPKFPELDMIIIGPDRYKPQIISGMIKSINTQLGAARVTQTDRVSEEQLAAYYADPHARAIIYVSDREAFGLPPLEGLVHGCPPIVADTPLTREIFGDAAFFVKESGSPEHIAEAMRHALTDIVQREHILQARGTLLERYSWSRHADRFLAIIEALAHH